MAKLLAASLGVAAVIGQVPDLREGDCVRALADIDYENMPKVSKHARGMVTGKGIAWSGRQWRFKAGVDKPAQFQQRNAVIHRSMVEKLSETEGYGPIRRESDGLCLTVFELDGLNDGKTPQAPKLQFWECAPGWTDQMFIYPACGSGPGQLRWVKDPQMCVFRQIARQKIVLSECEWTQPFIFEIEGKNLKVGTADNDAADENQPSACFTIPDSTTSTEFESTVGACSDLDFPGMWEATTLDV